jgi:AcrR family transcriptional regulator
VTTAIAPATAEQVGEIQTLLQSLGQPRRVLDRDRERALTSRQRELLADLQRLSFANGFAQLTMATLAAQLRCSLRTLYALAPSRDELVLIAVDRNLWRVGHSARAAIRSEMSAIEAVRAYLRAATVAVSERSAAFARDLAAVPAAHTLAEGHRRYLYDVTKAMLDLAVRRGEIGPVNTTAVARVLAGLGGLFSQPEVIPTLVGTPKESADEVLEIILRSLERGRS